ncbi:hypothetical protein BCR44DRAFT_79884 [Catenaria anguillulae PL171]|uniref:Uncharacterized protein n=1 Tax=Catenaria anguillulae PL171 TaxID=765915 RepID=A0A1Y2I6B2_9FUNG|nr:hypothetical protein BCR44DRAFT_79884 [Catenaria anguillulae PL171]
MANDPRCPSLPPASAKYQASNNCSLPDCSDDEDSSPTQNSATSVGEILGENRHAWSLFTKLRARRGPAWDALADLEARFADLKGLRRLFGEYVMTAIEQRPFGDFSARDVEETLRYRIHNIAPAEKLVIDRWSNVAQAVVEETIFGRVTTFHGHVRRDFAIIDNLNNTKSVFLPHLFLRFDYFPTIDAVHASRPVQYLVSFGRYFTRFTSGSGPPLQRYLLTEGTSGVPILSKDRLGVIGLDQFVAAAHLVPYFGSMAAEEGITRDNCVEKCNKWLLNVYVDKETVIRQREASFMYYLR